MLSEIPTVDIFAGPGGLAEGFSTVPADRGLRAFRVKLSIERDENAHSTLLLRSFVRQFGMQEQLPDEYYAYLRRDITRSMLFDAFPVQALSAAGEAWRKTLGPSARESVRVRISSALKHRGNLPWVLIGGPPCQAYSLVGRSRMRGYVEGFENDKRHTLYKEYLSILADHEPDVFVMENVKGLLSSEHRGEKIAGRIFQDLGDPRKALRRQGASPGFSLFPLTSSSPARTWAEGAEANEFIVRAEDHGIPQARHRIIIVGVRSDHVARLGTRLSAPRLQPVRSRVSAKEAIGDLSALRSGVSRQADTLEAWTKIVLDARETNWFRQVAPDVRVAIQNASQCIKNDGPKSRGAEFFNSLGISSPAASQFRDERLAGVCNHQSRSHIAGDLHRYLFASCFAAVRGVSPRLSEFPTELLPAHGNVELAVKGKMFSDRFRVQLANTPCTTVTSHIAKDGHYFIHYDPKQARSLTVREAARIQTFPDNYFFEGPRTSQYHQVGNAVPPLLARKIGEAVFRLLKVIIQ